MNVKAETLLVVLFDLCCIENGFLCSTWDEWIHIQSPSLPMSVRPSHLGMTNRNTNTMTKTNANTMSVRPSHLGKQLFSSPGLESR